MTHTANDFVVVAPATTVDVDGKVVPTPYGDVVLVGKATRTNDGMWVCLANVHGSLCRVQLRAPDSFAG